MWTVVDLSQLTRITRKYTSTALVLKQYHKQVWYVYEVSRDKQVTNPTVLLYL